MRDRLASARTPRGHANTPDLIPANARANGSTILLRPSVDECDVGLLYVAARELGSQLAVSFVILGHHDQAAGFFVEAMHNARAQLSANAR